MSTFTPANPDFRTRTRDSFARMRFMDTIGARLRRVDPGRLDAVEHALRSHLYYRQVDPQRTLAEAMLRPVPPPRRSGCPFFATWVESMPVACPCP